MYEVEVILKYKSTDEGFEYWVKWKGYGYEDNSWVFEKDMNALERFYNYW